MPTLSFPSNPSLNDTYTFGGKTWVWTGSYWALQSTGSINDIPIGNTTPATGAFTTLTSTGNTILGDIAGNLLPAANITYDIGNTTNRFRDIYLANSTIYLGEASISADGANLNLPATVVIGNVALTESGGNLALPANTTVGGDSVVTPKIANVQIATSNWTIKDDTAVDLTGGYIVINGSGFATGASVIIGSTAAASATVISSSVIRAQINAASAGTYVVYVVNPDGSVAILVNGLTYSGTPTWVTGSTLDSQQTDTEISIQLAATGANTYALAAGNTLPGNLTLSSGGLLAGNVSVETETVYSFTIDAIDTELQESPRTFSLTVTVTVADPYFAYTTLLLPGNGTNNATNNTFLDSSTNNFTITRNGNTTQGTFSPFSPTGWSNYFDGTSDEISVVSNAAFALAADFTIECWAFPLEQVQRYPSLMVLESTNIFLQYDHDDAPGKFTFVIGGVRMTPSATQAPNTWYHIAAVRSGSTVTLYVNGTSVATATNSTAYGNSTLRIGAGETVSAELAYTGSISNFRLVKGTAVYTGNFTPPTAPLTAVSGTSLLTCQSNRFIDNSTNNFAITVAGNTSIQAFSPFVPAADWSAATYGGSGYFDGTGDYLKYATNNSLVNWYSQSTTIEAWIYPTASVSYTNSYPSVVTNANTGGNENYWGFGINGLNVRFGYFGSAGGSNVQSTGTVALNTWTHIAFVYNNSDSSIKLYINGVNDGSGTKAGTPESDSTYGLLTGGWSGGSFAGYISGLRIVKGTAVYTSNFTPPTAPPTAIANTSLLLNYTNAGISDATAKNDFETTGDAKISTTQSKWGGSSIALDGTGDALTSLSKDLFNFGTGNFTVECWARFNSFGTFAPIFSNAYLFYVGSSGGMLLYNGSSDVASGAGGALSTGTWYHLAWTRSSGTVKMFINGTQTGSNATVTASIGRGSATNVGVWSGTYLNGNINDLRVTRGIARYTTNFTPPTAAFPIQ